MVLGTPEKVEFQSTDDKPTTRRKPAAKGVTASDLEGLIAAGFWMYGQTRPEHLRAAWDFSAKDCSAIADPASRIMGKLPAKALAHVNNALDPVALVIAAYAIVSEGARREKALNEHLAKVLAENPELARQYAERERVKRGGKPLATTGAHTGSGPAGNSRNGVESRPGGGGVPIDYDLPMSGHNAEDGF